MGPGHTMESLLSSMHCSNHHKRVPRRSVPKVNKCTQVNMDLEEKNPSSDLSLSPTTGLSGKSEHCSGSTSPSQKDVSSSSQEQSITAALLPQLPAPPPLPPGCKVPLPPLSMPGINGPSLPSPLLCSNPGCSHPTCGCGEQPHSKTPTLRMKVLHWQKLPSDVVRQSHSIWAVMSGSSKDLVEPDYASLELLFSVPPTIPTEKTGPKIKKKNEITVIGPKKSLLLNIFLKQFKCSNEEIAAMIQKGDMSKLDAEILRQLLKLLPEDQEINSLKSCKETSQLANADQFYLHLLEVPSYQLRIECMLICEETRILLECLWPKAQAIRAACETILTSHRLPVFCQLILKIGNFLNYEVEKNHRDLLQLPRDLDFVSKAVGIHIDAMQAEASANLKKLLEIEKRLFLSADDLKIQHGKSVQVGNGSLNASKDLQKEFATIEKKKEELADYLCEDRKKLSLEDVFSTMKTFREIFLKTLQENQERKEQAAKSEKRKKQFKGEDAKRPKGEYGKCSTFNN
ncbi:inverted formin-2-like isoform X6 [Anomalospiza imberbis]|uniref:inverted formin-2-like isoform X6 n=1 Tax=Anomalospiza imberbis TaxID=187417 RepID=UPI00358FEE99